MTQKKIIPSHIPLVRSAYSKRKRVYTAVNPDDKRTRESFTEECDINNILGRYASTGLLEHVNGKTPTYGDVGQQDLHALLNLVKKTDALFEALPNSVTENFGSYAEYLAFAEKPENRAELEKMGIIAPSTVETELEPSAAPQGDSQTPPSADAAGEQPLDPLDV